MTYICEIRTHQWLTHWILYTQKWDAKKWSVLNCRNYSTSNLKLWALQQIHSTTCLF